MKTVAAFGRGEEPAGEYDVRFVASALRPEALTDRQRQLHAYWTECGGADGLALGDFDPLRVPDALGYLHLLEYGADRDDFFYRFFGSVAAKSALDNMHRKWVLDHPGAAGRKFWAHYKALMASGAPWVGLVEMIDSSHVAPYWRRLVLPLRPPQPEGYACVTLAEPFEQRPDGG